MFKMHKSLGNIFFNAYFCGGLFILNYHIFLALEIKTLVEPDFK